MMLFHPGAASIDCDDCKRYVYDLERGVRKTYKAGAAREEKPYLRAPGAPLQCAECPKESPDNAAACQLSNRNWKTVATYRQIRAVGATADMLVDDLLRSNMAIVDDVFREWERDQASRHLLDEMFPILRRMVNR